MHFFKQLRTLKYKWAWISIAIAGLFALLASVAGIQRAQAASFNAGDYTMKVRSAKDNSVYVPDFPLFYLQQTINGASLYAPMTSTGIDTNPNWTILRMWLANGANGTIGNGGTATTSAVPENNFTPFQSLTAGGLTTGTATQFSGNTTYQLHSYRPLDSDGNRYARINGGYSGNNYYLPDGMPAITLDGAGTMSVVENAGKSVGALYSVSGGKLLYLTLHTVKSIKIIDKDTGKAISGAKLKLSGMQGTQGGTVKYDRATNPSQANTDLLVPNDYVDANSGHGGPFYWAAGDQSFQSLTGADGYYLPNGTFSLAMSQDDKLSVIGGNRSDVSVSDDGQTLTLSLTPVPPAGSKKDMQLQKVDTNNKAIKGAQFTVTPADNNNDMKATRSNATDGDGLTTIDVPQSTTITSRTVKVKETTAPAGYMPDSTTYYAHWTFGKGFDQIGTSANNLGTAAVSNLSLADGKLVMKNATIPAKGATPYTIQYFDADYTATSGTAGAKGADQSKGINGAALPATVPNSTVGAGGEDYTGLSSVIYGAATDGTALTTLANSKQVSQRTSGGTDGVGRVQALWTDQALPISQTNNDLYAQINAAIQNRLLPTEKSGVTIDYTVQDPTMLGRAATGTPAHDYYTFAQTLALNTDSTNTAHVTGSVKQTRLEYNTNTWGNRGSTEKIYLQQVKHVKLVGSDGLAMANAKLTFQDANKDIGVTGTTDSTGSAELTPIDGNGDATDVFAWPSSPLTLTSITRANGAPMSLPSNAAVSLTLDPTTDKLQATGANISADGQTITYQLPAEKAHMISAFNAVPDASKSNKPLDHVAVTVAGAKSSTTLTTGTNGSVALKAADIAALAYGDATNIPAAGTSVDLTLSATRTGVNGQLDYNALAQYQLKYTFGTGFSLVGDSAITHPQVFQASSKEGFPTLGDGDLGFYMHRSILQSQTLTTGEGTNASYTFTFDLPSGKKTATITTGSTVLYPGVATIPDPDTLFGTGTVSNDTPINVTVTRNAVNGISGATLPMNLVYTRYMGYVATDSTNGSPLGDAVTDYLSNAPKAVAQPAGATAHFSWANTENNVTWQTADTFFINGNAVAAGTQITDSVVGGSVAFTDTSERVLNFGSHDVSGDAQTFAANDPTHAIYAGQERSTSTTDSVDPVTSGVMTLYNHWSAADTTDPFSVQVTQTGKPGTGWTVGLNVTQPRTKEPINTITDSSMQMPAGVAMVQMSKDDEKFWQYDETDNPKKTDLSLGTDEKDITTLAMVSTEHSNDAVQDQSSAIWNFYWPSSAITLSVPAGVNAGDYNAVMNWNLTLGTPSEQ